MWQAKDRNYETVSSLKSLIQKRKLSPKGKSGPCAHSLGCLCTTHTNLWVLGSTVLYHQHKFSSLIKEISLTSERRHDFRLHSVLHSPRPQLPWHSYRTTASYPNTVDLGHLPKIEAYHAHTGTNLLRTAVFFKTLYKIEFWSYKKTMPIFEEISAQRFRKNLEKNLRVFKNILKYLFLNFNLVWN